MHFHKQGLVFLVVLIAGLCGPSLLVSQDSSSPGQTDTDNASQQDSPGTDEAGAENLDDIFASAEDVQESGSQSTDQSAVLNKVEASHGIQFTGTLAATAGMYSGWEAFPQTAEDISGSFAVAGGYDFEIDLALAAKIDRTLSVYASLEMVYPDYSLATAQVFIDYTLMDLFFIRGGKQEITWGQGTFFNFGDLLPDGDLALQTVFTLDPFTFTAIVQGDADYYSSTGSDVSLKRTEYAAKVELRLPAAFAYVAARYQAMDPFALTAGGSFSFLGIDAKAELRLDAPESWIDPQSAHEKSALTEGEVDYDLSETEWDWMLNGSLFYEIKDPKIQLFAEYCYNADQAALANDHRTAIVVKIPDIGGGIKAAVNWVHIWADQSGYVLGGVQIPVWDHLRLRLALLGRYGEDGTVGRKIDPPDEDLPGYQVAFIIGMSINSPF